MNIEGIETVGDEDALLLGDEPLVRRPVLPSRSARKLAEIVATHLLEVLATRADLEPALLRDLRGRLAERLGTE